MNECQSTTLEAVGSYQPITQRELVQVVPEYKSLKVKHALDFLYERGFVTIEDADQERDGKFRRIEDEDTVVINTNPFNFPDDDQAVLPWETAPDEEDVLEEQLPDGIEVNSTIELELTAEQTILFEKMRNDVSKTCGPMDREEFMDWILREARRFTEV